MAEGDVTRRLAAIVSADVVGYSRLMGEDEAGTLGQLKTHRRELIDPKIAEHGGRIVKTMGDGLLIEFPSVVEAMNCSVEVQRGMAERSADIAEDRRIEFRIGDRILDRWQRRTHPPGDGNAAVDLDRREDRHPGPGVR